MSPVRFWPWTLKVNSADCERIGLDGQSSQRLESLPVDSVWVGTLLVAALLACKGGQREKSEGTSTRSADPCSGQRVKTTLGLLWLCDDVGKAAGNVALYDASGKRLRSIPTGIEVKRLETDSIRRDAGHVDAAVCVASGEHAGTVGFVQNTKIFGRKCE